MANTKSTQHEIDLTGSLNLNKFKADIKPYEGFNERNAPYYGGCLSPLYIKDDGFQGERFQFYNGDIYYMNGTSFFKKLDSGSELILSLSSNAGFSKTKISGDYRNYYETDVYIQPSLLNCAYIKDNNVYGAYFGSSLHYKYFSSNEVYVQSLINTLADNGRCVLVETKSNDGAHNYLYVFYVQSDQVREVKKMDLTDNIKLFPSTLLWFDDSNANVFYVNGIRCTINTNSWTVNEGYIVVSNAEDLNNTNDNVTILYLNEIWYYEDFSDPNSLHRYTSLSSALRSGYPLRIPVHGPKGTYVWFIQRAPLVNQASFSTSTTWVNGPGDLIQLKYTTATTTDIFGGLNSELPQHFPRVTSDKSIIQWLRGGESGSSSTGDKVLLHSDLGYTYSESTTTYNTLKKWSVGTVDGIAFPLPAGGYYDAKGHFRLLYSNTGSLQGISYWEDADSVDSIGTLLTSWGSVDNTKPINFTRYSVFYFDLDENSWVKIDSRGGIQDFKIIGNLAVFNVAEYFNAVNLDTLERVHFASDWNNRIFTKRNSNNTGIRSDNAYLINSGATTGFTNEYVHLYSSGQNVNWLNSQPASTTFAPVVVYSNTENDNDGITANGANTLDGKNPVDVYKDWKYETTITEIIPSSDTIVTNEKRDALADTIYPSDVRYNIPLFFDVVTSPYDLTIVRFGETGFLVMYYDTKIRYQYLASSIANFGNAFIIQGQAYGITRNKIYSISYGNNTIQSVQPVTTIEGLEYIGATIYNAYFYSPTARIIYSFGADNNLVVFSQADTFAEITGASYIPATGSILIGVNEVEGETETGCLYVLNERFGIYRINDIDGFKYANYLNDNSVGCITTENKLYRLKYEEDETFTKKDIVLDTAFYGAGSNVVSVNDCWYIRVTDPEHNPGEIKLAVSTLTDIGRQTETRTFKIKATDWDELTDTVYIRFQPKLQRAVGVSLHIESPFKIGYIGVGATPETLQLNKGTI